MFQGLVPFTVDFCFYVFIYKKTRKRDVLKPSAKKKHSRETAPLTVGVAGEPADDGAERLAGAAGGGRHPLHVQGDQGKGFLGKKTPSGLCFLMENQIV